MPNLNPNWAGTDEHIGPMASDYPAFINSQANNLMQLNQQNETPQDAVSMLKQLASEDPAYQELLIQLLAERENQERAYKWYEDFNNSYYQRTTADLEKAGLSPWLALQSLGSAGSGSLSPAGTWSGTSGSTISSKIKEQKMQNSAQNLQKGIGAFASVIAAIAGALIMALV